jgi:Restriction endonuclease
MTEETTTWISYEQVAIYLLNQIADVLELERVEGKQSLEGRSSGTRWELDGKGVKVGDEGFVIIECRRYTKSKRKQEQVAGLAYRILDTGAEGGIIVSPLGLQEGAAKVAAAERIQTVYMEPNSTPTDYFVRFLNSIFLGLSDRANATDELKVEITRVGAET